MIANIENDTVAAYFKENYPTQIDVLIMPIEGKIKYIPKTDKFIKLLKPRNVIPCHYWSQEYLIEFINYIQGKDYNVQFLKSNKFQILRKNFTKSQIVILGRSSL